MAKGLALAARRWQLLQNNLHALLAAAAASLKRSVVRMRDFAFVSNKRRAAAPERAQSLLGRDRFLALLTLALADVAFVFSFALG